MVTKRSGPGGLSYITVRHSVRADGNSAFRFRMADLARAGIELNTLWSTPGASGCNGVSYLSRSDREIGFPLTCVGVAECGALMG